MKLREFIAKTCTFLAQALSEENGQPSSRRLLLCAAIFAAIFFSAGLLIKHPEMCVDLIKFVIITAAGLFGYTYAKNQPPSPPAAPAV